MAFLGESFNASDMPESSGFDPLPAGEYNVSIASADLTNTKNGSGQYLKLRLDVVGPTHAGRVLFTNINIRNANQKAEEIGRQQLGQIMRAVGLPSLTDTDQLIGGQMAVKVTVKHDEQYGDGNEVKAFKAIGGSAAPRPAAGAAPAQPAAASAPPWARR